jgi:hypothetical protein
LKVFDKMRADKARAASDEYFFKIQSLNFKVQISRERERERERERGAERGA